MWPAVAAGVIVVIGVATALLVGRREPRVDQGPITALLERASAEGLVIPGGEAGAISPTLAYRSGSVMDEGLEPALEQLQADYERDPRSGPRFHWLVSGLVAAGQHGLARNYIAEGLRRAPTDSRLLTLAGIVSYRSGDSAQAERRLREALDASPGDLTAMLNLGLVVAEAYGAGPASPYLEGVIRKAPGSPLAERARRALVNHRRP